MVNIVRNRNDDGKVPVKARMMSIHHRLVTIKPTGRQAFK
ncbi:unnamed protein product [Haemonchus placei]|uniref:Uncharacterized protein n=1 Tax=Haemonchus placei TaxID=6290 RepID=A0A3P7TP86_HAEPC|nr:unnamed protein product [Haemonchus placei]